MIIAYLLKLFQLMWACPALMVKVKIGGIKLKLSFFMRVQKMSSTIWKIRQVDPDKNTREKLMARQTLTEPMLGVVVLCIDVGDVALEPPFRRVFIKTSKLLGINIYN